MPKTKEVTKSKRALVVNLQKNGLSVRQIRAAVRCHLSTVIRICKRFENSGYLDKIKRCGQPKNLMFGERDMSHLAKQICKAKQVLKFENYHI